MSATASRRASKARPGRPCQLVDFAARELRSALGERVTRVVSVPAPATSKSHALLELASDEPAFWWQPAGTERRDLEPGASLALGEIHRLQATGHSRSRILAVAADRLWRRVEARHHPQLLDGAPRALPEPRLFGGLAFAPGAAEDEPWQPFGDARFTLPRLAYRRLGSRATLSVALAGDRPGARLALAAALEELEQALERLEALAWASETTPELYPLEDGLDELSRAYEGQVESIRDGIASGRLSKVVAARRLDLQLRSGAEHAATSSAAPTEPDIVARLGTAGPGCTLFAQRLSGRLFFGATPERLVELRSRQVRTEALAGSIPRGLCDDREAARALMTSAKDRWEHELVVRHLSAALRPMCTMLDVRHEPAVRRLRNILHLHTPVRGELRASTHVLELAGALHPTPALGGAPTAEALEWIAAREPQPRGWYAGPIGWFDRRGDGELWVALRSCLLDGERVHLYAGAGIVADSDPELEFRETQAKLAPMRQVLAPWLEEPARLDAAVR